MKRPNRKPVGLPGIPEPFTVEAYGPIDWYVLRDGQDVGWVALTRGRDGRLWVGGYLMNEPPSSLGEPVGWRPALTDSVYDVDLGLVAEAVKDVIVALDMRQDGVFVPGDWHQWFESTLKKD